LPNNDEGVYNRDEGIIGIGETSRCFDLTLTHELGHLVYDYGNVETRLGWYEAVQNTSAYQLLLNMSPSEDEDPETPKFGGVLRGNGIWEREQTDTGMVRYLIRKEELFARAFAQYIAYVGDNRAMQEEIKQRSRPIIDTVYYPFHWIKEDFNAIFQELDSLFREKNWR
jgi:hypothetical protein